MNFVLISKGNIEPKVAIHAEILIVHKLKVVGLKSIGNQIEGVALPIVTIVICNI